MGQAEEFRVAALRAQVGPPLPDAGEPGRSRVRVVENRPVDLAAAEQGAAATGSTTVTSAMHGLLRDDGRSRAEFLACTGVQR